jgi:mono/diheme cytochrome c family protein
MNKPAIITLVIFTLCGLPACDRDKNNPGYDYFPDMAYSRAYETYESNPNFADSITLQTYVKGTVSREAEIYPYERSEAGIAKAVALKNPLLPDSANLSRGREVYNNVCLQCHGENADGQGHLFVSGKYLYPPANLISPKIVIRTDGQMYHVITVGYGIMEPHGVIVRPIDRWKVILYIRNLQAKALQSQTNK